MPKVPEQFVPESGGEQEKPKSAYRLFGQIQELVREDASLEELKEAKRKFEEFWKMSEEHSKSNPPKKMDLSKVKEDSPNDILLIEPDDIEILQDLLERYIKKFEGGK